MNGGGFYHPQDATDATQEISPTKGARVLHILGEIFGVTDTLGAELLEISRENFRQRPARARSA